MVLALALSRAYADARTDAKDQVNFGITVAQRGLWKEATFRWEKAAELDPTYGAAWNNLGIGYEQLGRFDDAGRRTRRRSKSSRTTPTSATTTTCSGRFMTVRTAAAIVSAALALAVAGCTGFYEIPVETPIQAKIDVTSFQRVLVAGFLSGGSLAIDANTETARLLRSQLRTKQELRVIDTEALSLVERSTGAWAGRRRPRHGAPRPRIKDEKELKAYAVIFKDTEFWKKLGAEYENPLIVTGSALFTEISRSGVVSRPQSVGQSQGIEEYQTGSRRTAI